MATIIDRRKSGKNKSVENRKRFMERYKKQIKKAVKGVSGDQNMTDIGKETDIVIQDTSEPTFEYDYHTGKRKRVLPGNKEYNTGDTVRKPSQDAEGSGGSPGGEGMDEYTFTLTREEFLDLYFSDMELPDFLKKSLIDTTKTKRVRAGYSKEGVHARLNLKKTFETSLQRKIAAKANKEKKKKPIFLDEEDLRYNFYKLENEPIKKAVMFCLMDVSGSMTEKDKDLAKRFYLLLHLFLHKEYEAVELVFIRHTHEAKEVQEKEFFYGLETGGTIVSEALNLMLSIIESRYDPEYWNIYAAQVSDGDNWITDNTQTLDLLDQKILPIVQYYAYIQTRRRKGDLASLFYIYDDIINRHKHFQKKRVLSPKDIYPVLRELFKKGNSNG